MDILIHIHTLHIYLTYTLLKVTNEQAVYKYLRTSIETFLARMRVIKLQYLFEDIT